MQSKRDQMQKTDLEVFSKLIIAGIILLTNLSCEKIPEQNDSEIILPAKSFKHCTSCPWMVPISGGKFKMGARPSNSISPRVKPQIQVNIISFAMSATEITYKQWLLCVQDGGCEEYIPSKFGLSDQNLPVMGVSLEDIRNYLNWLNTKSDEGTYRLPTESEWEYAARAGTATKYWWGDTADSEYLRWGRKPSKTVPYGVININIAPDPVAQYPANPFGLYDILDNVTEWVEGCYVPMESIPRDGSPAIDQERCYPVWRSSTPIGPAELKTAFARYKARSTNERATHLGFRVAWSN